MSLREDIEKREEKILAPFAVKSFSSIGRKIKEKEDPYRTVFQRDRDRIIHSTAFRRLEYKTQVFVNCEGDYYRTRLTHTIEVSQIARTIARALNLNEDLVEAIALAHDLGHPPFGHAGESALEKIMKTRGGFEHNIQGLRVIELLETKGSGSRGLNLTWEVREGIYKHSERALGNAGLPSEVSEYKPEWQRSLECQVVDIADSIAYDSHDIDDGLYSGLLKMSSLKQLKLWQRAEMVFSKEKGNQGQMGIRRRTRKIIDMEVVDLIENTQYLLNEFGIKTLFDVRLLGRRIVGFSQKMKKEKEELEKFLYKNLYQDPKIVEMAEKSKNSLIFLFKTYSKNIRKMPSFFQRWARRVGKSRAICDYIAGMTDRFAQEEYKKLLDTNPTFYSPDYEKKGSKNL